MNFSKWSAQIHSLRKKQFEQQLNWQSSRQTICETVSEFLQEDFDNSEESFKLLLSMNTFLHNYAPYAQMNDGYVQARQDVLYKAFRLSHDMQMENGTHPTSYFRLRDKNLQVVLKGFLSQLTTSEEVYKKGKKIINMNLELLDTKMTNKRTIQVQSVRALQYKGRIIGSFYRHCKPTNSKIVSAFVALTHAKRRMEPLVNPWTNYYQSQLHIHRFAIEKDKRDLEAARNVLNQVKFGDPNLQEQIKKQYKTINYLLKER